LVIADIEGRFLTVIIVVLVIYNKQLGVCYFAAVWDGAKMALEKSEFRSQNSEFRSQKSAFVGTILISDY